jgi:hypothetical protein
MNNVEPPQEYLRWGDLKAWEPRITFYLMKKWRDAGLIHLVHVGRAGVPYYRKSDVKKLFQ